MGNDVSGYVFNKRRVITYRKNLCKGDYLIDDRGKSGTLVNFKISEGETVSIRFGDNNKPLEGATPKSGKPKNDNEDLLSRIIDKVNIMYQGQFSEADRVIVESIYDKMVTTAKKKLTKQANNTDEKQFEESIFPQIFDEVARGCYVEQMDSFAKLFENSDFYRNVMTQMAKVMYENYKKKKDDVPEKDTLPAEF